MPQPANSIAAPGSAPRAAAQTAGKSSLFRTSDGRSFGRTFLLMCALFLLSGVCNSMLDTLNRHFQNSFEINKMQSAFVQNAFYLGYFLMAYPAGLMARRFGYKGGILIGLSIIMLGAFWFVPATRIGTYWAFLTGLFVLAVGFTSIETIANPYATVLGPPETGAARINLAQSCNGIGWMIGPTLAGFFILSATGEVNKSNDSLYIPYLLLGLLAAAMLGVIAFSPVPDLHREQESRAAAKTQTAVQWSIWQRPHFVFAIAAQFAYVAAQTGIFSYFINYLASDAPALSAATAERLPGYMTALKGDAYHVTDRGAATLLSFGGFGLFLLGRITGSIALRVVKAHRMLAVYSAANVFMMFLVVLKLGWPSVVALFLSFFLMSISYPTIFALGIHGLAEQTKKASSFIVMSILGGAIMPLFMGWLADTYGMRLGFLMPMGGFVIVALYGFAWPSLHARSARSPQSA
jgi:FHS family L-fucose permease-like MFS transporter